MRGRVLNGELYAPRFQKLINVHVITDCFVKISLQSSEQIQLVILKHILMYLSTLISLYIIAKVL